MPRRALPKDIDERMIQATVVIGASSSVDKVTTLKVAHACHINEATVYRHFESKENLLYRAYRLLDETTGAYLSGLQADLSAPGAAERIWNTLFSYLTAHSDGTVYYSYFRHSRYFSREAEEAGCVEACFLRWLSAFGERRGADAMRKCRLLTAFIIETLLCFACRALSEAPDVRAQLCSDSFALVYNGVCALLA